MVVAGSGSLARAVVYSLAAAVRRPTAVWLLARSGPALAEMAYVASARSRCSASPATFHAAAADLTCREALEGRLAAIAPDIVLQCASYHSPWEAADAPSPWTALVRRAGFGVTLPLQAMPAVEMARAIEGAAPAALLVNACFPDAVNPVLAGLGLPVHCGVGNAALLAASLRSALALEDPSALHVLAHHVHLHAPERPDEEALAWRDGAAVADVFSLLAPQRAAGRRELNHVTGHLAALLVRDLLEGDEVAACLPGPLGLPGGYPVTVHGPRMTLRLPPATTRDGAVAWNQAAAVRDGVRVAGGRAEFSPVVERELRTHLPELAAGFALEDVAGACRALLALRERLRTAGPVPAGGPAA